ncbi:hypothetical protein HU200_018903 [Digitaria exilis]|uniref:Peptidase metallopeptidase domain-containing protein n=1 Tax=Digitaria exilis TaxID=1010633 RepID=A0A835F3Y7_9POAL|nr:hypothetical protein HU200_018903 [Digitaria exilis]
MSESTSGRFTFFEGEPRWTQADPLVLTYSISTSSEASVVDDLPPEAVSAALRSAFARWARVIPVEFVEAEADDYYGADIKVGFYVGDHGDGSPFDGKNGVVAHAYAPKDGRLHFDAAESWAVDVGSETPASWAMDLETVAVHEIGHILGLGHSSSPEAVMFPYIDIGERKVELSVDGIEGVQLLYGSNPLFSHPSSSVRTGRGGWLAGSVSFVGAVLAMLVTHV